LFNGDNRRKSTILSTSGRSRPPRKLFKGGERFYVPTLPFGIQSNARDDFPDPKDQYDYQPRNGNVYIF
jgi:hypothetical protein